MFVVGASLTVPFFTIVLRKGYGLGAQAMAGGSFKAPFFTVAWPTGEFGGMGLEGAVKLGYRKELEAIEDPAERKALYEEMVANAYEHGKAVEHRDLLRDRRRDRPGRVAPLDQPRARRGAAAAGADGEEAAVHRYLVSERGRALTGRSAQQLESLRGAGAPRPGDRRARCAPRTSSQSNHAGLKRRSERSFA